MRASARVSTGRAQSSRSAAVLSATSRALRRPPIYAASRLIQVPTTLLAQVDSSIGGKVGVNLTSGKNLVGSFHSPSLVVCDPDVLGSLGRREFRAGLYEVVKYGVISSAPLFDRVAGGLTAIFNRDGALLTSLVADCCRIKAQVVMTDERESGLRRILNFGHTVGHALEARHGIPALPAWRGDRLRHAGGRSSLVHPRPHDERR